MNKNTNFYRLGIIGILLIAIILSCSYLANASYPDYNIDYTLKSNISLNSTNVGNIIVNKGTYISKTYNVSDLLSNYTFQRYDEIKWLGTNYIKINNSNGFLIGLQTNEVFRFANTGEYKIYLANDNNNFSMLTINPEDDLRLKLRIDSPQFNFIYNTDERNIGSEYVYNITANITTQIQPGTYNYTINYITNQLNKTVNKTLTIESLQSFSDVNNTLTNINLSSDLYKSVGVITIQNTGNVNYPLHVSATGEGAAFLNYPNSIDTYKGMPTYISFLAQIPSAQADGVYPVDIKLYSDHQINHYLFNITIKDTTLPQITNITISSIESYKPYKIQIQTKDNVGISYATINIDDLNITNMTKDQNVFSYSSTMNTTGTHRFNLCVFDISNNSYCEIKDYNFEKMQIVDYNETNTFFSVKLGKYSSMQILNITYDLPEPINITFKSFNDNRINVTDYYAGYDLRLVDGNGAKYSFANITDTIQIKNPGIIYLEIRGENYTSYDGSLSFIVSPLMESIDNMNFNGKFIDYETGEDKKIPWYSGQELAIDFIDTGYYETSYYEIQPFKIPLSVDFDNIVVPTSTKQKFLEDEKLQESINKTIRQRFYFALFVIALFIGLIISFGFLIYWIYIRPTRLHLKTVDLAPEELKKYTYYGNSGFRKV